MKKFLTKTFGDKAFVRAVLAVVIPMVLQNGIASLVGLADNVMVGSMGTEQMSGVSLANQLIFIFNFCVFGGMDGVGILTSQFYGTGNLKGIRDTFRIKFIYVLILCAVIGTVFLAFGKNLISLFLVQGDTSGDTALTLASGYEYLKIMVIGIVPYALVNVYASTLRQGGETRIPMVACMVALVFNLCGNYLLINGNFGFPKLGVRGAAISTALSYFAELAVIFTIVHIKRKKYTWVNGLARLEKPQAGLLAKCVPCAIPLIINQAVYSTGVSFVTQCYSTRGLAAVASLNITSAVFNVFNTMYVGMGCAAAILVGQILGTGDMEKAKDADRKIVSLTVLVGVLVGLILAVCSPIVPLFYNTTDAIRASASKLILVIAVSAPLFSYCVAAMFTIRAGGKTVIAFLLDSGMVWLVSIPVAFILSRFTNLGIIPMYLICQQLNLIKAGVSYFLLKSGIWCRKMISE